MKKNVNSYLNLKINEKTRNWCRGFTLLELIVTIGIISLLVAAGVPTFNAYNKQNSARIAAQDVKNVLLEAQSLSKSPKINDKNIDFYYVSVEASQANNQNGKIVLGKGRFTKDESGNSTGFVEFMRPIKNFRIDSGVWIIKALPPDRDASETKVVFYYLAPTGEILFNELEPSPVIGYSPLCKALNNNINCHYAGDKNRKGYIQIRIKDLRDSQGLELGDETVIIDGHSGNISIEEKIINP